MYVRTKHKSMVIFFLIFFLWNMLSIFEFCLVVEKKGILLNYFSWEKSSSECFQGLLWEVLKEDMHNVQYVILHISSCHTRRALEWMLSMAAQLKGHPAIT